MPHRRQHANRFIAIGSAAVCLMLLTAAHAAAATVLLSENFDNVASLVPGGWKIVNNSSPVGTTDWFQGNPGVFTAQAGAPGAYVAGNFEAAAFGGNISDWLITPEVALDNGYVISFWARTEAGSIAPDRLELRMSTNHGSTNVGSTDSSVGDFSTLLLTINPAVAPGGFPESWALFSATVSGLGGATTGRFAFRYTVPDTSSNGDYIGIDSVTVVPEPGTLALVSFGILAAARARRSNAKRAHHS